MKTLLVTPVFILLSCQLSPNNHAPQKGALPLPGKDDVALVGTHPISLTQFIKIRSHTQSKEKDTVFEIATAWVLLRDWGEETLKVNSHQAFLLARYALKDLELSEVNLIVKRALGRLQSPEKVFEFVEKLKKKQRIQINHHALAAIQ